MDDLISRQAAIDKIWKLRRSQQMLDDTQKADMVMRGIYLVENSIKEVPSVQPRKGKWTRHFDGNEWYWYCSSCKEQWYEEDLWMGGNSFPNFCPHCSADMRGDNNDS